VLGPDDIAALQRAVRAVPVANDVAAYAVRVVGNTRPGQCAGGAWGNSSSAVPVRARRRRSCSWEKAHALLHGRMQVDFADIRALAPEILRHRLVLNFRARAEKIDADRLVTRVLEHVKTDGAS
jgi:MoxR-like ATPase